MFKGSNRVNNVFFSLPSLFLSVCLSVRAMVWAPDRECVWADDEWRTVEWWWETHTLRETQRDDITAPCSCPRIHTSHTHTHPLEVTHTHIHNCWISKVNLSISKTCFSFRTLSADSLDLEQEVDPLNVDHFSCTPLVSTTVWLYHCCKFWFVMSQKCVN